MAITIDQYPRSITPVGQQLMVTCSSTNVTEDGFRYKFVLDTGEFVYVAPAPINGVGFLDLRQFYQLTNVEILEAVSIHALTIEEPEQTGESGVILEIYEAWEVAGILTDDPDSLGPVSTTLSIWNASFQAEDGYRPDLDRFELDGETKRWLSDRTQSTHVWQYAGLYGFPQTGNKVYIPVRESDWGVMSMYDILGDVDKVRITIYQSNGTPVSGDYSVGDAYGQYPFYPANLNINVASLPEPQDYPNWRCITVQALDAMNNPLSVLYVLYNVALNDPQSCAYDTIRMAWVGFGGSWEYFNFTKKNEESVEIERKRYQQVLGTYGASFTQNGMQRGLTEVGNITKRFLTINSDWISEGEFLFLRGMMVSRQVHWVQDDGTFIPMLVEDNTYTEQRTRDGKLKNLTVKLSYANNLWT